MRLDLLDTGNDILVKRARGGGGIGKQPSRPALVEFALHLLIRFYSGAMVNDVRNSLHGELYSVMNAMVKDAAAAGALRKSVTLELVEHNGPGRPRVKWSFGEDKKEKPAPKVVIFPEVEAEAT